MLEPVWGCFRKRLQCTKPSVKFVALSGSTLWNRGGGIAQACEMYTLHIQASMQAGKACATDMATDEFLEPGRREPDGGMYVCVGHVYTGGARLCTFHNRAHRPSSTTVIK